MTPARNSKGIGGEASWPHMSFPSWIAALSALRVEHGCCHCSHKSQVGQSAQSPSYAKLDACAISSP